MYTVYNYQFIYVSILILNFFVPTFCVYLEWPLGEKRKYREKKLEGKRKKEENCIKTGKGLKNAGLGFNFQQFQVKSYLSERKNKEWSWKIDLYRNTGGVP